MDDGAFGMPLVVADGDQSPSESVYPAVCIQYFRTAFTEIVPVPEVPEDNKFADDHVDPSIDVR
jgi:hypothetical protein